MRGEKAQAATDGIREMIMECQTKGPPGAERSYFRLFLVRFSDDAKIDPNCDMKPVRQIDPDLIQIRGDGQRTNITAALRLAFDRLKPYMEGLQSHPERDQHPLPLVLLFSDGQHNVGEPPYTAASAIKDLSLGGDHVVIACAGVSIGEDRPDEATLSAIASGECYVHISGADALSTFIATVGSSGVSSAKDISDLIKREVEENGEDENEDEATR
jgi:hypothetical protein